MIECDVLVVGAGPAGSSAARAAALGGAKTIFIDKKREVGVPVQCAECIGKYLFPYLPFKIPKKLLKWPIKGISFWSEGITVERSGEMWEGFAIDRKIFDKWLANNAVNVGAKLLLETKLVDLEFNADYTVTRATVETVHGEKEIKPKVLIGADGVDSTVLKLLGFKIDFDKTGLVYGFEFKNLSIENPDMDKIFIGDFAPGGYGYFFPTTKNTANIGVAVLSKKDEINEFFNEFLKFLKIDKENAVEEKSGLVPFIRQTNKWNYGNVLLVGDTANQNFKPFVEGFIPSIICGDVAGKISAKSSALSTYEKNIMETFEDIWEYSNIVGDILFELRDKTDKLSNLIKLGIVSNIFKPEEYKVLTEYSYDMLVKRIEKGI